MAKLLCQSSSIQEKRSLATGDGVINRFERNAQPVHAPNAGTCDCPALQSRHSKIQYRSRIESPKIRRSTMEWVPIQYREFYDRPRMIVAEYRGRSYLFNCSFDEALDDYSPDYAVFVLPR